MEIKSITKQSIEALGDFLEYKEIKRVFSSLFSTNEKGFKELMISCSPENLASRKIIESLPFHYVETKTVPKELRKYFDQDDYVKRIYRLNLEEL